MFSNSRLLSALGGALIAFASATGIADAINPKAALVVAAVGGALTVFNERLQGGASKIQ